MTRQVFWLITKEFVIYSNGGCSGFEPDFPFDLLSVQLFKPYLINSYSIAYYYNLICWCWQGAKNHYWHRDKTDIKYYRTFVCCKIKMLLFFWHFSGKNFAFSLHNKWKQIFFYFFEKAGKIYPLSFHIKWVEFFSETDFLNRL